MLFGSKRNEKKCYGLHLNCSGRRLRVDRVLTSDFCSIGSVNFLFHRYLQLINFALSMQYLTFVLLPTVFRPKKVSQL